MGGWACWATGLARAPWCAQGACTPGPQPQRSSGADGSKGQSFLGCLLMYLWEWGARLRRGSQCRDASRVFGVLAFKGPRRLQSPSAGSALKMASARCCLLPRSPGAATGVDPPSWPGWPRAIASGKNGELVAPRFLVGEHRGCAAFDHVGQQGLVTLRPIWRISSLALGDSTNRMSAPARAPGLGAAQGLVEPRLLRASVRAMMRKSGDWLFHRRADLAHHVFHGDDPPAGVYPHFWGILGCSSWMACAPAAS